MTERPQDMGSARPLTADELEQRRRADGEFEEPGTLDTDLPDGPIDADVIEQHQIVEDPDDEERPLE